MMFTEEQLRVARDRRAGIVGEIEQLERRRARIAESLAQIEEQLRASEEDKALLDRVIGRLEGWARAGK
jgi:septal ring factor EnvC (AmiA/AmiB activator)